MHPAIVSGMGMARNNSLGTDSSWLNVEIEQFLFIQLKKWILSWITYTSLCPPMIASPLPSSTKACLWSMIGNFGPVKKQKTSHLQLLVRICKMAILMMIIENVNYSLLFQTVLGGPRISWFQNSLSPLFRDLVLGTNFVKSSPFRALRGKKKKKIENWKFYINAFFVDCFCCFYLLICIMNLSPLWACIFTLYTVFPRIVSAETILFWKLECGNYSREETIQGRKLLFYFAFSMYKKVSTLE